MQWKEDTTADIYGLFGLQHTNNNNNNNNNNICQQLAEEKIKNILTDVNYSKITKHISKN